jgi:hypothetical protein
MSERDDLTSTLTRELTERAHTVDGTLLHLADVRGRARSIRRRRTATAVASVAAAVAVIVPTASLATHTGGSPEPAPAVTQTPTPSPTQTATDDGHQPAPGVLDVSNLPTGAAPRIEYVTDRRVLHQVDGSTVEIPTQYPVRSFTTLSDGTHLWLTSHDSTPYVEVQDADGTMHAPVPSSQWDLGVNTSHSVGAWVRPDGQVMVWNAGATEPLAYGDPVRATDDMRMGPVLGDHCGGSDDACEVYVNVSDTRSDPSWTPWLVDANGTQPSLDGSYLILSDASESGMVIGVRKLTETGSCSVLLGGGEFQGFSTCRHTLESFSPDSELILATPAYGDGFGMGDLGMYNLQGDLLFQRQSTQKAQASYQPPEWEDGSHVLAAFFQEGKWSIVRVASDGSMEYAVAPIDGGVENPYVLETGGPVLGD